MIIMMANIPMTGHTVNGDDTIGRMGDDRHDEYEGVIGEDDVYSIAMMTMMTIMTMTKMIQ